MLLSTIWPWRWNPREKEERERDRKKEIHIPFFGFRDKYGMT